MDKGGIDGKRPLHVCICGDKCCNIFTFGKPVFTIIEPPPSRVVFVLVGTPSTDIRLLARFTALHNVIDIYILIDIKVHFQKVPHGVRSGS